MRLLTGFPQVFPHRGVTSLQFDFERFSRIATGVYPEAVTSYTLQDVLTIFRYFFGAYELNRGQVHPPIRRDQIKRIIEVMDSYDLNGVVGGLDIIDPDSYPDLIDAYFQTRFPRCNYRINHFFSGKIRTIRMFETIY